MKCKLVTIALVALALSGCANISALTGTTIEERCQTRRAAIAGFDQLEQNGVLTESSRKERSAYRYYVATVCAAVQ